jgi:hypothetical protein
VRGLPDEHCRRGTALLIVLVTVVLLVPAVAMLSGLASTRIQHYKLQHDGKFTDVLLEQAYLAIDLWLSNAADDVVLSDDAETPTVAILNDRILIDANRAVMIRVTAWDQCGMPSPSSLRSVSILRTAVPEPVLRAIDHIEFERSQPLGLDQFVAARASASNQAVHSSMERVQAFPSHEDSDPLVFRDEDRGPESPTRIQHEHSSVACREPRIGAYIATHNENPQKINLNTAPLPLIAAALRMAGRGGMEIIQQARAEQKAVPMGDLPEIDAPQQHAPALVSTSDTWAFRVDVSTPVITKSWWLVYQQSNARRSRKQTSKWECVQRLAITE